MGGVEDGVRGLMRRPGTRATTLVEVVAAHAALDVGLQMHGQLHGLESALAGVLDGRIQIAEAGKREELLGDIVLDPRGGAQRGAWDRPAR